MIIILIIISDFCKYHLFLGFSNINMPLYSQKMYIVNFIKYFNLIFKKFVTKMLLP